MLIAQLSDLHIKPPGRLAYRQVDTAAMLRDCVAHLVALTPKPDLVVITGDLVDLGLDEEYAHLLPILAPIQAEILAIPGNHDERSAFRRAFPEIARLAPDGFVHFAVRRGALRIVGLDTLVPGEGGGELCAERLTWIDGTLAADPDTPTLIVMHHPPFSTGISHMDRIGLKGREAFAAIIAKHPQVQAILCGHVHRSIFSRIDRCPVMIAPSTAHQVALDLSDDGPSAFRLEPTGYMLHCWSDGSLVSHVAVPGAWPGPFPFFDQDGKLID